MAKNLLLSLHIVAFVSWMAGILYLYRLVINHVEETEEIVKSRFRNMERRLYKYITVPAMVATFVAGIGMILLDPGYYLRAHWLHAKLCLVLALLGSTLYAGQVVRRLNAGSVPQSARYFRILNEVPTLLMIGIVLLVVFKPF